MHMVITGASRGIGQGLMQGYTARGDNVTGTSRSGDGGLIRLDVTRPDDIRALGTALDAQPVDLLVCNAGIYPDKGQNLADGYPPEMWAETFAVNVTGVFLTVQELLPNLQMAARPRIAIISSQMASDARAPGGSYIYRASKAAALNLGRNLSADLAHLGVAVGIYHPGWVQTDMGGLTAEITAEAAAAGLMQRFDELDMATTGCFRTWDGRDHPY
ncbi:SDR family NAD(P)-dependent oxidoreductase [Lutimaribacter sp. EGI FJ00015]|uniref:SDR family NAD(P)-dependent oxidoreductase n=1 Tax=Lutimaribacter degradans TaxID=2945989 RepID=A0ACC5ZV01_9RHOB|nr:SDR family NAD(P)-dependent oxidoreductase [Lutimaribacter sp. EGI FJ00013]MCM2561384.1 SDR family NAD(P)-dependent oxidoreductase [Lutimaribacter sp. EGI FJ00013]MCO0612906.1 SDR family NAD(P)-dependent oxidoreductase [Lutimaribacter sp. EGI FJ00015]MCO0635564.1 SDR family NAD(P)-dependent oxidoreductase [Lutimaribacter sp. EGI FJ00014]